MIVGFYFYVLQIASVLESLKPSVLLTLVSFHYHLNVCMYVYARELYLTLCSMV